MSIIEVPARKRVEAYKHSRHGNWPTDGAVQPGRVEAVNVHVLHRDVGRCVVGENAAARVVVQRLAGRASPRIGRSAYPGADSVVGRDFETLNIDIAGAFQVECISQTEARKYLGQIRRVELGVGRTACIAGSVVLAENARVLQGSSCGDWRIET